MNAEIQEYSKEINESEVQIQPIINPEDSQEEPSRKTRVSQRNRKMTQKQLDNLMIFKDKKLESTPPLV